MMRSVLKPRNAFPDLRERNLKNTNILSRSLFPAMPFQQHYTHLMTALEETTAKLPEVTLTACERFVDIAGLASSDIGTGTAWSADTVTKLTLRIYQQSKEDTIRTRSLNLIDKLMENSA